MSKTLKDKQKQVSSPPASPSTPHGDEYNELDKVRNILFGAQSRDLEQRLARMEQYFGQELESVRSTFEKRLGTLETYIKTEDVEFNKRLNEFKKEHGHCLAEQNIKIQELETSHQHALKSITTQASKTEQELRSMVIDLSKTMSTALEEKAENLTEMMRKADEELRLLKTDRFDLADLFEEFSVRLRNNTERPVDKA